MIKSAINSIEDKILNIIRESNSLELELSICLRRQDMENLPDGAIDYLWEEERYLREHLLENDRLIQIIQRGN